MARPTLPRLRRGRAPSAGAVEERTEPRISELAADGLTWVHADRPGALEVTYLAERFGFHELDIEDVLSKRQRPKIDEYPDYLFSVLHFPRYDKSIGRLNAAEQPRSAGVIPEDAGSPAGSLRVRLSWWGPLVDSRSHAAEHLPSPPRAAARRDGPRSGRVR